MMRNSLTTLALGLILSTNANSSLVCTNVAEGGFITEVQTWQVGTTKPEFFLPIEQLSCMADGLELNYIRTRFTGIPKVLKGNGPFIWRGSNAQYIIDNL